MPTYDYQQGLNIGSIAASIGVIIRIATSHDFSTLTQDELQTIVLAIVGLVTAGLAWFHRVKNGKATAIGFKQN